MDADARLGKTRMNADAGLEETRMDADARLEETRMNADERGSKAVTSRIVSAPPHSHVPLQAAESSRSLRTTRTSSAE